MKKANRRLHAIRQLKRCGVPGQDIVQVYCAIVRSTLEYASVVYVNLPRYISDSIEGIDKRTMAIIYPGKNYNEALVNANIVTLQERKIAACKRFISGPTPQKPLHQHVLDRIDVAASSYQLRPRRNNGRFLKPCNFIQLSLVKSSRISLLLN